MSFLVFIAAALLLISGLLKVRSGARVGVGFSPFAIGEVLAGAALGAGAGMGALGMDVLPRWAVPFAVALLLFSTTEHGLRLRSHRKSRIETEGGRLAAHVKYLSGRKDKP
jgi:hypothetical protein